MDAASSQPQQRSSSDHAGVGSDDSARIVTFAGLLDKLKPEELSLANMQRRWSGEFFSIFSAFTFGLLCFRLFSARKARD